MSRIELTGLKSGTPVGFMAALGAFRNADLIEELRGTRLSWVPFGGQWVAALHLPVSLEIDAFLGHLLHRIQGLGDRREFLWADAVKSAKREEFIAPASSAIREATAEGHGLADWFAAFGSELVLDDGKVESTPFDMTVARQQFLADARWLTNGFAGGDGKDGDTSSLASLREALFGPWRYRDDQHSLGWDPSTLLMGAFTPKAPTAMQKNGVRGAVWLAMESLPYFPCVYDGGLATRGLVRAGKKQRFVWPIWTEPMSDGEIRILLSQTSEAPVEELKARGIAAVYSSAIFKPNKYLTSFQAAVLVG